MHVRASRGIEFIFRCDPVFFGSPMHATEILAEAASVGAIAERERVAAQQVVTMQLDGSVLSGKAKDELAGLILKTIAEAVLVVAADGRVVGFNAKASAMFGYPDDAFLGLSVEALIPERFRRKHRMMREGFSADSPPRMMGSNRDLYALRRDGSEFPVEAGLGPMIADGDAYVIVSLVDMTARKRAEEEVLRLNARMADLLEARTMVLEDTRQTLHARTLELRDALARLADAERRKAEQERKRLSLELHDEIGQQLTALSINFEMIHRRCTDPAAAVPIRNASEIIKGLFASIREIVTQLRPPQLDDLGLPAALRWHLDRVRQTSFLKITFDENLGDARLPPDVEMSCFRIVQESITNTLRHASARVLEVRITRAPGQIGLSISDDGVGFDADRLGADSDRCGHFGLAGMRERVLGMQGRFAVITAPGLGCRIQVDIPVAPLTDQVAS